MLVSRFRRPAVVLAALAALIAAPLTNSPTAAAADPPRSSVNASEPAANDTVKGDPPVAANEASANITGASARYQNDFVTFTMKLEKGDGLSDPASLLFWMITDSTQSCCVNFVSLRKSTSGLKIVMGDPEAPIDPNDASQKCGNSSLSYNLSTGDYIASVAASCISPDSLPSFMWAANRRVPTASGEASDTTANSEEALVASNVTNARVSGYWAIGSDGKVYGFGDAIKTTEQLTPSLNTVDIESSPHGTGYWTLDDKGVVKGHGPFVYGDVTDLQAGERAVSMSSTPSGAGYWVFTNKGRAIGFGDADKNIGDVSKISLNAEVLDSAAMPSGKGYYLVAADGGVFALGDAKFEGSMGGTKLNKPVQSIVPDPDGQGYWLVASDGGVFAFKAVFRGSTGSMTLNKPMTGMVPFGNGYLMVAEDGGVFNYSDRPFSGSLGNNPPANPIVSIAALN